MGGEGIVRGIAGLSSNGAGNFNDFFVGHKNDLIG